jgi:PAS domain S-box-containing protein
MEGDPLDGLRALLDAGTHTVLGWWSRLWPGTPSADAGSLELAVRGANDGLFVMDLATRMIDCWPRYLELLGYADHPDECSRSVDEQAKLLHPDDAARATAALEHALTTGEPFDCEYRVRRRDGAYRWFHGRGMRLADATGRLRFAGCLTDISEHKRQGQLMEQSSAAARVGGWEVDCVTHTLYWTPETFRINETSPDEYVPTLETSARFFTPKSLQVIDEAARRAVKDGIPWDLELEAVTARGRRIPVR